MSIAGGPGRGEVGEQDGDHGVGKGKGGGRTEGGSKESSEVSWSGVEGFITCLEYIYC